LPALVHVCLLLFPLSGAAEALSVFTGVEPVRHLAKAVGGDRVRVAVLVPPGQSPHTFEPSPRQLAALERADLYFAAGMPFEAAWVARLQRALPRLQVVHLLPGAAGHGHNHDLDHEHGDPHPWTDPLAAIVLADRIRQGLAQADPAGAEGYDDRFRALERRLTAAHGAMAAILEPHRGRAFVVYHPAWGALAERYGLRQLAVESAGKSPGARHLVEVITRARDEGACAVFVQPQVSRRAAEVVANAVGAHVVAMDPLAPGLIDNLRHVAAKLARQLERPCPR
jgi:zinc transport system substrate-binding protein